MTGVTQSRASLTTASSEHLPTQHDDDNEYLPDNLNVDITALLPSQVPDQTSKIKLKELRYMIFWMVVTLVIPYRVGVKNI